MGEQQEDTMGGLAGLDVKVLGNALKSSHLAALSAMRQHYSKEKAAVPVSWNVEINFAEMLSGSTLLASLTWSIPKSFPTRSISQLSIEVVWPSISENMAKKASLPGIWLPTSGALHIVVKMTAELPHETCRCVIILACSSNAPDTKELVLIAVQNYPLLNFQSFLSLNIHPNGEKLCWSAALRNLFEKIFSWKFNSLFWSEWSWKPTRTL